MRLGIRKDTRSRTAPASRPQEHADAWRPRGGAWALTPPALIPFGSFVPPPRGSRRPAPESDRR